MLLQIFQPHTTRIAPRAPAMARSLENPSTSLSDPDAWLFDAWGGGLSAAGVNVNRKTALTYAAFWRAVTLRANTVAKVPLHVYKRVDEGKERDPSHRAYNLLRYRPNAEMNAETFIKTLEAHAMLHGNGYAFINRDGAANPLSMHPLDPESTYPLRINGRLGYVTHDANGKEIPLRPDQVFHVKGLGYDGLVGYSLLQFARDSLGLGMTLVQFQSRFFSNGAKPGLILEAPAGVTFTVESAGKLREQFERLYAGVDNAYRTAVLQDGITAKPLSINARDSQMLESAQQGIRDVANWTGVPPHKLGDQTRNAYNSLEQENQSFLDDTIDPDLVAFEQEAREKLLTEAEKKADSHVIEFKREALVRADLAARAAYFDKAVGGPWLLADEARSAENKNPLPDGQGAKLYPPRGASTQSEPTPSAGDEPPSSSDQPGKNSARLDELHRDLVIDAARRVVKRITARARRVSRTSLKFPDFLDGLARSHRQTALALLATPIAIRHDDPAAAQALVAQAADRLIGEIRSKLDAVYSTVRPADFLESIKQTTARLETDLPGMIADQVLAGPALVTEVAA